MVRSVAELTDVRCLDNPGFELDYMVSVVFCLEAGIPWRRYNFSVPAVHRSCKILGSWCAALSAYDEAYPVSWRQRL